MPAQLLALDQGASILLDKPILLLGRHPECDIQIDSRKISRRHCCIAQVSDYLVVRDLGSTNGIRINGLRVVEGRLNAGDELTIGNTRYKVTWDAVPAAPGKPSAPSARIDDSMLESSDEPIPINEADDDEAPPRPLPPPEAKPEKPFVLPDELERMPPNNLIPNKTPRPSESGVHPS